MAGGIPFITNYCDNTTGLSAMTGIASFTVSSGRWRATTISTSTGMKPNALPVFKNQFSELFVPTLSAGEVAAVVRWVDSSSGNGIMFDVASDGTCGFVTITAGTFTPQPTANITLPPTPFRVRAEAIGNTFYGYVNGTLVITYSSASSSFLSGCPGAFIFTGTLANTEIERWEAGPLPETAPPIGGNVLGVLRPIRSFR